MLVPVGQILDCFHNPILVMDRERRVIWRNAAAQCVLGSRGAPGERTGKLALGSPVLDKLLGQTLEAFANGGTGQGTRGLRIARPDSARSWLLLVRPIESPSSTGMTFLVQLVGRMRPRCPPLRALADLYDLSARERELVASLLRSRSLDEAAKRLRIARETMRCHLKRIFRKCEVASQQELLSLLHSISQFEP